MRPIRLLWLVLLLAAGWSAWWGWNAWQTVAEMRAWLEARRAEGWQAEWSDISVSGYPNRIDVTIDDLMLANTAGGWAWSAPFFQVLKLSYDEDHVILIFPDQMTLQTPYERIEISGEDLRASASFVPGRARELVDATVVFNALEMQSDAGWTSSVDEARLATRPNAEDAALRDIGLEVSGLKPRAPAMERLADAGLVPGTIERLAADLTVRFDAPWDRTALEGARPQPRDIDIGELAAKWGQLELRAAGSLTVDEDGQPDGEVLVKATNWQEILDVARQSGAVPGGVADTVESALRMLSRLAGSSRTLDIPLNFRDGRMRAGPVPLGSAPVIRLP